MSSFRGVESLSVMAAEIDTCVSVRTLIYACKSRLGVFNGLIGLSTFLKLWMFLALPCLAFVRVLLSGGKRYEICLF